jgi:hypothetical protein
VVGTYPRKTFEELYIKSDIPIVLIGDMREATRGTAVCHNVIGDGRSIAYRATEYLIRHGHRKIALAIWDRKYIWSQEEIRGYAEALVDNSIQPDPSWVVDMPFPDEAADPLADIYKQRMQQLEQQLAVWSHQGNAPTALVHGCTSEMQMHDVLHCYFHDHFPLDATVTFAWMEMLKSSYSGIRDVVAICAKYEDVARRAMELILSPSTVNDRPQREILEKTYMYRRQNGVWREVQSETK